MVYLSKRGYEFSFTWIFVIFVGAAIVSFAIYFAMQITETQQIARDMAQGKSLSVLLTPIETDLEEGKFAKIYLPDPARIYFGCENHSSFNPFGSQNIRLSIKPPLGRVWEDNQASPLTFHNKYFFVSGEKNDFKEAITEGEKEYYVLSKPLFLPFKIADVMIIYSDRQKFCFNNLNSAPPDFQRKIKQINMTNVFLNNCNPSEHKIICFSGSCDILINMGGNYVKKNDRYLHFILSSDNKDPYTLIYAAIFSDPDIYECQIKRLMHHASKLADLYLKKSRYINLQTNGVCSGLATQSILSSFSSKLSSITSSPDLIQLKLFMQQQDFINFEETSGGNGCELF